MSSVAVAVPALVLLALYTVFQFSRWAYCARPLRLNIKWLQIHFSATMLRLAAAWLTCFALNLAVFAVLFAILTVSGVLAPWWASWTSLALVVVLTRLPGLRWIGDRVLFRLQRAAFSPTLPPPDECPTPTPTARPPRDQPPPDDK